MRKINRIFIQKALNLLLHALSKLNTLTHSLTKALNTFFLNDQTTYRISRSDE